MNTKSLRVALAQMDVVAGQPTENLSTMAALVEQARDGGADIVVFPEMCVGGYFLADKWNDTAFVEYLGSFNERVLALSRGIGIVFGNVGTSYLSPSHTGKDGRPARYNMAFFAHEGAWVPREGDAVAGRYMKSLQPDYRMFDDERYFTSSIDDAGFYPEYELDPCWLAPFLFQKDGRSYRIGLQVCEDLWSGDYAHDITRHYAGQNCDLIINISASPWTLRKDTGRAKRVAEHARRLGSIPPLVYVNAVGMQNTGKNVLAFDGGSAVFSRAGAKTGSCRDDFEQELALFDLNLDTGDAIACTAPQGASYADEDEKALDALVSALRRFDAQVFPFHPKWIIGLSGGIDSSVTAALLVLAFGDASRIVGYNLATRYNSDATKMNAYKLAQALGISLRNGSIEEAVTATDSVLQRYGYPPEASNGLTQENIQARIRGHMLSTFAAIEGGVIMNNGNKVEVALGYATLYGDAIGALSPLGDVTKVRLFNLARLINRRLGTEAVPENLIPTETEGGYNWETMPSAELKDAQKDPMKWFYHDWLIERLMDYPGYGVENLMEAYLENRLLASPVAKWVRFYGLDEPQTFIDDLEWVLRQMRGSVFKRIQMPPAITITRGSFGFDFRENQVRCENTQRYESLKERILALA